MSFPFETEEEEKEFEDKSEYDVPTEYGIDFATGQLSGEIVTGIEAIKVWIWLALRTPRYRYVIYPWDYGNELDEMIGTSHTMEYIETEVQRMIEECLLVNEHIKAISDYEISYTKDKLICKFRVTTDYGEANISV